MKTIFTDEYKLILKRLKNSRKRCGLTQLEVAKRIGKPQSYISKIENGERRLDIIELKCFCRLYKLSMKSFCT